MRRMLVAAVAAFGFVLTGCAGQPAAPAGAADTPQLVVEAAWVRTTTGAEDPSMTGAFMSIVNPGETEVRLVGAEYADAGMVQIHEMVKVEDKMVMQEAKGGVAVPAGGHLHLAPGGYHVMLMMLKKELPVGEEVRLTLKFSDGSTVAVTAPVKEFVEEEDHYHSPMPSASRSS